jgi:hypothetical protein
LRNIQELLKEEACQGGRKEGNRKERNNRYEINWLKNIGGCVQNLNTKVNI